MQKQEKMTSKSRSHIQDMSVLVESNFSWRKANEHMCNAEVNKKYVLKRKRGKERDVLLPTKASGHYLRLFLYLFLFF